MHSRRDYEKLIRELHVEVRMYIPLTYLIWGRSALNDGIKMDYVTVLKLV